MSEISSAAATEVNPMSAVIGLLKSMRPRQWTKNGIIFFGLVFALRLYDLTAVRTVVAAFILFCLVSSAIYIVNDIVDAERDRLHPTKRFRPIAAGVVSAPTAIAVAAILFLLSIGGSIALSQPFAAMVVLYVILMLAYSFALKHIVLIDVFTIAGGFVIRAAAGALVIDEPISPWLYVCTVLASLFLGFGKRRHELATLDGDQVNHREILHEYSIPLLDHLLVIITASVIMAYSLYTFSAENLPHNHSMMFTIPFVLYGMFRYLYLVYIRGAGGSPEEIFLQDKPILLSVALWGLAVVVILYLAPR